MSSDETDIMASENHTNPGIGLTVIIRSDHNKLMVKNTIEAIDFAEKIIVFNSDDPGSTAHKERSYKTVEQDVTFKETSNPGNDLVTELKSPWIFVMNAGEKVTPSLQHEIIRTLSRNPKESGFRVPLLRYFMGKKIHGIQQPKKPVLRLLRREHVKAEGIFQTEDLPEDTPVGNLKHPLISETLYTCDVFLKEINRDIDLEIQKSEKGVRHTGWYSLVMTPVFRFLKYFVIRGGFLSGVEGFAFSFFQAYAVRIKFTKLWMNQNALPVHDKIN